MEIKSELHLDNRSRCKQSATAIELQPFVWHHISEREREREIHYVHSASLAYEDGIVFMSEPSAAKQ